MPQSVFRIFLFKEFAEYIRQTTFQRKIKFIQNHHTWKPDYSNFNKPGMVHMTLLENMRHDHIHSRGWSDIGQNITIFPDGRIGLCRALDIIPAGIYGANTGGICIENLGNFDINGDTMSAAQKEAIINTNAILCMKFGLRPRPAEVVYHHWYDTKGKRFSDEDINSGKVLLNKLQKTCPGTNFFSAPGQAFKGNTITAATANFYPLITTAMSQLQQAPVTPVHTTEKTVTADTLNVRAGRGVGFDIVRRLSRNMRIQVYETVNEWSRINPATEEWVSAKYLL